MTNTWLKEAKLLSQSFELSFVYTSNQQGGGEEAGGGGECRFTCDK